jgi:hypothetical protein
LFRTCKCASLTWGSLVSETSESKGEMWLKN